MSGGVGHGRSLASGRGDRRPRRDSGSIGGMVALILADGDVPPRSDLDLAWPGWDDGIEAVIAADGGARHAAALGVAIDLWVGDGDSIGEDALAALAGGRRAARTVATGQGRVRHGAGDRAALRSATSAC